MDDDFLRYGYYAQGIFRALTATQMNDPRVIRAIKNAGVRLGIPKSKIGDHCVDFLRDAPIIIVRKRAWDDRWIEAWLPTCRALSCDPHWYDDYFQPCPMDVLPRLPRKEAKLRVWTIGSILRAETLYKRMLKSKRTS